MVPFAICRPRLNFGQGSFRLWNSLDAFFLLVQKFSPTSYKYMWSEVFSLQSIRLGRKKTNLLSTFCVWNQGLPSFVWFKLAAHMLIVFFLSESGRRSKKLKISRLLASNHNGSGEYTKRGSKTLYYQYFKQVKFTPPALILGLKRINPFATLLEQFVCVFFEI